MTDAGLVSWATINNYALGTFRRASPWLKDLEIREPPPPPTPAGPYECDYSLQAKTADYSKWGMRA